MNVFVNENDMHLYLFSRVVNTKTCHKLNNINYFLLVKDLFIYILRVFSFFRYMK